jgi:hypothetical protein
MQSSVLIRAILLIVVALIAFRLLSGLLHWLVNTGVTIALVAGLIWLAWRILGGGQRSAL